MSNENQKPVRELLNELSENVNIYMGENYSRDIQKSSGLSYPLITAIRRKSERVNNMKLKNIIEIANSVGYRVTEIKLEKIED